MIQTLEEKLVSALGAFAEENKLGDSELEALLGEVVLNGRKFKKGGVGVIDKDAFALVDERRNSIVVASQKWEGREANQSELVVIDGSNVANSIPVTDASTLRIVLFLPADVRYINFSNNSGGRYSR